MNQKPAVDLTEGDVNLSPERNKWQARHLDKSTKQFLEEDAELFLHQSLSTPCLNALESADGAGVVDLQGRELLDFHGNYVHQVGFGHPRVIEAIKKQLDELPFCTRRYTNRPAVELARQLTKLAPGDLNRVLLAPGGTSAIGMAIKLARISTGRFKTISMWDSFHGASLDSISVGGEAVFRKGIGPLMPGAEHAPPPDPVGCPFKCGNECSLACADYIEYMLEKEGDVAAVVAETIRCTPSIPPRDYWKRIRAACDRRGALLILDEIPTALGRTGKFFAFEHYDVIPDMVVIGKGLGGGVFPLAALIAKEELNVAQTTALGHYTHEKNPVACAAALATLDVIREEALLQRATDLGDWFKGELEKLQLKHKAIREVRGIGLLIGVRLNSVGSMTAAEFAEKVMYHCLSKGLNFKITMGDMLTLAPALTIQRSELIRAITFLDQSFACVVGDCCVEINSVTGL